MSPDYYAAGTRGPIEARIVGSGFDLLPEGIEAILSSNNERPAEHVQSAGMVYRLGLVSRSETELVFRGTYEGSYNVQQYLGVIVLGEEVLWTNTTEPLP